VCAAVVGLVLAPRTALAVDPFEIQVYDGTANAPGVPGIELHTNRVFSGATSATPPEVPLHHRTHATLEPSLGILPWWEIGAYLQSALLADGTFEYAGAKVRSKFVSPEGWQPHLRIGANLELSLLPERFDRSRWGTELRPIVAWENDAWIFAANPIVGIAWTGGGLREGPALEPAAMAKLKVRELVAIGVEYYGSLGPLASPSPLREQEHYVYEAVDLLSVPGFELNVGVGEGLTGESSGVVAKVIVGYVWESVPPVTRAAQGPARPRIGRAR
jgi:hypothetical protein